MSTRAKVVWILILVIILGLGGGIYYVMTNLDALVKAAIEKYGSQATQTAVRVQQVRIRLSEGTATISGLTVANPDGFQTPHAFVLDEVHVRINTRALTEQKIEIDEIRVTSPQVNYEMNSEKTGNLNVLSQRLDSGEQASANKKITENDQALVLNIKRFVVQNARLHAVVVPLKNKEYDLKLPPLVLSNLKGTPEQITRQIINQLLNQAKDAIKHGALGQELDQLKDTTRQKIEEHKAQIKEKTDAKVEQEKQKAKEKLKGLLH